MLNPTLVKPTVQQVMSTQKQTLMSLRQVTVNVVSVVGNTVAGIMQSVKENPNDSEGCFQMDLGDIFVISIIVLSICFGFLIGN